MTHALLCPSPDPLTLFVMLAVVVTAPVLAGAAVGLAIGGVIKALRRARLK